MMIVARELRQHFPRQGSGRDGAPLGPLEVLAGVDLAVARAEVVAVLGPSGSGKTTLLGLLAGLDRPSHGDVELDGVVLGALSEEERAALRSSKLGFVFQNFQLLPTLTALENVMVPLELAGDAGPEDPEAQARRLLERVGLGDRLAHYPTELSGGEQQRVGVARAFANRPRILFADEPTGNLDRETGRHIADLLLELNREAQTTLVIVTHDLELAERAHRIVHLRDGRVSRIEERAAS